MSSISSILSSNLKRLRKAKKFSQEDLGEKARVSAASIQSYELERTWPAPSYIESIAKALGCDPSDLFKKEDPDQKNIVETYKNLTDSLLEQIKKLSRQLESIDRASLLARKIVAAPQRLRQALSEIIFISSKFDSDDIDLIYQVAKKLASLHKEPAKSSVKVQKKTNHGN